MFTKFSLSVTQGTRSTIIKFTRTIDMPAWASRRSDVIKWFAQDLNLVWGAYALQSGSIHKEHAFWYYSHARREIVLLDLETPGYGMGGGGLSFGELDKIEKPAVLSGAVIHPVGIFPAGTTGTGVISGAALDVGFHKGNVTWELEKGSPN